MKKMVRILVVVCLGAVVCLTPFSGDLLVVNDPQPSDAIVVLDGDDRDVRVTLGVNLLQSRLAPRLFYDVAEGTIFGKPITGMATAYLAETAGPLRGQVAICPTHAHSTDEETLYVGQCLQSLGARRALIVTSSYHTRRALFIFRRRLPQYQWSAAAADDPETFNPAWWRKREWAKTFLAESMKLVWWVAVDRWRGRPAV